jgi:hypothetical protein
MLPLQTGSQRFEILNVAANKRFPTPFDIFPTLWKKGRTAFLS